MILPNTFLLSPKNNFNLYFFLKGLKKTLLFVPDEHIIIFLLPNSFNNLLIRISIKFIFSILIFALFLNLLDPSFDMIKIPALCLLIIL